MGGVTFFGGSPANGRVPRTDNQCRSQMAERRKFSRLPFPAETVLVAGNRRFTTQLIDISMKGALVSAPQGWVGKNGTPAVLQIRLEDSDVVIAMEVEAAHVEPTRLGLRCRSIDVDSMTHLRRLLELNLGDPSLVERELAQLL